MMVEEAISASSTPVEQALQRRLIVRLDRLTYSIEEVSRILGISRSHAYKAVETGEIPSIVIGHRKLVSKAVLDEILSAKSNWNRAEGNNHKENNVIRNQSGQIQ